MKPSWLNNQDPIQKDLDRLLIIVEGLILRRKFPDDHSIVKDLIAEAKAMIAKYTEDLGAKPEVRPTVAWKQKALTLRAALLSSVTNHPKPDGSPCFCPKAIGDEEHCIDAERCALIASALDTSAEDT